MSYDLFFTRREGAPSERDLRKYFKAQRNFTLCEEGCAAGYNNERTGVYFSFDPREPTDDADVPLAFNLNFCRPHVFGLEAEPALTRFVQHFGLAVDDPQSHGMGQGPYTPEGFLRGWNAGNRFGTSAIASMNPHDFALTLPTAKLEEAWRWNFVFDELYAHLEDNLDALPPCFIPKVTLLTKEQKVFTGVVWTADMPLFLPPVDFVLSTNEADGLVAAPMAAVLPLLPIHSELRHAGVSAVVVDEPGERTHAIKRVMKRAAFTSVPMDHVVNEELLSIQQ